MRFSSWFGLCEGISFRPSTCVGAYGPRARCLRVYAPGIGVYIRVSIYAYTRICMHRICMHILYIYIYIYIYAYIAYTRISVDIRVYHLCATNPPLPHNTETQHVKIVNFFIIKLIKISKNRRFKRSRVYTRTI